MAQIECQSSPSAPSPLERACRLYIPGSNPVQAFSELVAKEEFHCLHALIQGAHQVQRGATVEQSRQT